jgi:ubiquinone/menaquinone biosynthesis C-methylase UbiE
MKLHLGCGYKHLDGFINIDIRNLETVDVIDDISKLSKFDDNSISLIYCCHVLEHFGRHEYMKVLKRWYDLLKKGGVLRISVPDFEKVVENYNQNSDIDLIRGFLYGGQNYDENYHYCAWDFNKLKSDLLLVGFKEVYRYNWKETEHSDIDDFSQSYLPHMDKERGTLMSLNIEAKK